ncbi:hypothetical protein Tco_0218047 [Tanacetum coccineum]
MQTTRYILMQSSHAQLEIYTADIVKRGGKVTGKGEQGKWQESGFNWICFWCRFKDKGKGKMVEEEQVKKMSKKELLTLDEELALKLQAEEDEEERLAREKA